MIANLITIMRRTGDAIIPVIQSIWNLVETLWENRDSNWEDD